MTEKKPQPPSETFENAVRKAGSLVVDCELCGRTHFATLETAHFDEGELDDLVAKAKKDPDKYVQDPSYDSVPWGTVDGKQAVIGCPCNGLRRYEDFIWGNRFVIAEYLRNRSAEAAERAGREAEEFKDLPT